MTCLSAFGMICSKKVGVDPVSSGILKDIVSLTKDSVPNVRFKAVKTLQALAPLVSKATRTDIIVPAVRRLKTDSDDDVAFYAKKALPVITA